MKPILPMLVLSMMAATAYADPTPTPSAAPTPSIADAKAAELSLHRVERLVILHKVEGDYQAKFKGLAVQPVAFQDTSEPAFNVTLSQYAGADGTTKTLLIPLTQDGHPLHETVGAGALAAGAPAWPDADPVTMSENALHYILDNNTTIPALVPFYVGLTSLSISQGTDASGTQVAVVEIHAAPTDPLLRILIKTNGDFESYEVVPRTE